MTKNNRTTRSTEHTATYSKYSRYEFIIILIFGNCEYTQRKFFQILKLFVLGI